MLSFVYTWEVEIWRERLNYSIGRTEIWKKYAKSGWLIDEMLMRSDCVKED
jgi:phosphoribosyl-AMP cyclohydrolase